MMEVGREILIRQGAMGESIVLYVFDMCTDNYYVGKGRGGVVPFRMPHVTSQYCPARTPNLCLLLH